MAATGPQSLALSDGARERRAAYDADPKTDPAAKKFQHLGFDEVLNRQLGVMDLTAITLCLENDLPLRVYAMRSEGALARILDGKNEGTLVTNQ